MEAEQIKLRHRQDDDDENQNGVGGGGRSTSGTKISTNFRFLLITTTIVVLIAAAATTPSSSSSSLARNISGKNLFRHFLSRQRTTTGNSTVRTGSLKRWRRSDSDVSSSSSSRASAAAAAAIFLQFSKESRERMLKSSKDALVVTKKSYLRKDWCKTEPLIQKIRETGCFTRTVVNRFCYGQCNSFYIPRNTKRATGSGSEASFKSCAFCKPKRFRWISVTLRCPGRNPPIKTKRIQRIKKCKCISEILQ